MKRASAVLLLLLVAGCGNLMDRRDSSATAGASDRMTVADACAYSSTDFRCPPAYDYGAH